VSAQLHAIIASAAFLPILDEALERARQLPRSPRSYRHDVPGWLLWRVMGPPVRFRAKTAAAFVHPAEILARPLDFRIRSIATGAGDPPAPPARHLWQAERAADEIVSPTGHS